MLNVPLERMSVSYSMLEGNATARFRGLVATDMVAQQARRKDITYKNKVGAKEMLAIIRRVRPLKHGS